MKKFFKKFKVLLVAFLFAAMFMGVMAPTKEANASIKGYQLYTATDNVWLNTSPNGLSPTGYKIKKGETVLWVSKYSESTMKVQTLGGTGYVSKSDFKELTTKKLSVPVCKQENSYYCGPATVQEVLKFYGVSKTQNSLATALGTTTSGTTMTEIPSVLNKYQSKHTYKYYQYSSKSDFQKKVLLDVANGYPVVIDVNTTSYKSDWGYSTSGHYMCISGFDITNNKMTVTDPHYKYYRTKAYSADLVYNVVNAHFRQAIVY